MWKNSSNEPAFINVKKKKQKWEHWEKSILKIEGLNQGQEGKEG